MTGGVRSFLRRLAIPALWVPDPASPPDATDIFCRPPSDSRQTTPLMVSKHFYVYASRFPLASGHLLIVPREHIPVYAEVPILWHRELERVIATVRSFQREMYGKESFAREQGSPPGSPGNRQSVRHAHFHLIPFDGDGSPLPAFAGETKLRSFADLARYRWTKGHYHYVEIGGDRRVVPDVGPGVEEAERALRDRIGNDWDPVKLQPIKFEDPVGREMFCDVIGRWNTWLDRHGVATVGKGLTRTELRPHAAVEL